MAGLLRVSRHSLLGSAEWVGMSYEAEEGERSPLLKLPPSTVDDMRDSERVIARSRAALAPILEHAENVERFDAAVRDARLPVKKMYESAGLDYQLAKHAVWIAETVRGYEHEHPEIRSFGPSLVLLVREAERRFEREERADELPDLIRDVAGGMPRNAVREKYLPRAERRGPAAVIGAVRSGRMEQARRFFDDCNEEERASLVVFARGLNLIVDGGTSTGTESTDEAVSGPAASSVEAALVGLVS